jgi:hypothetical protein
MTCRTWLLAGAFAGGAILAACPASAGHYAYTQIQIGTNQYACATGINDSNHVVGEYYGAGDAPYGGYVYYSSGSFFEFDPPRNTGLLSPCSYIYSISNINNKNLTVNTYAVSSAHPFAPFTWSPATGKTKKLPAVSRLTMPTSINTAGVVVGSASKIGPFYQGHGFVVSGGVATEFDPPGSTGTLPLDIADNGTIVGFFSNSTGTHGFILPTSGTYTVVDVPGSTDTEILSIDTAGEVAGRFYSTTAEHYMGFTMSGANIVTYQYPGAGDTEILRALPSGLLIGNYTDSNSVEHGFSYLPDAYSTLDPAPGVAIRIQSVNDKGNFVGNGGGQPTGGFAYLAVCPPGTGVCLN